MIQNKPTAGLITKGIMARIIKKEIHTARRNEILDVARRLVYTKGYEGMSIQDILDELQISKGAFYHYFDSKGALLEALVERMVVEEVEPILNPIVQDPELSALEKLHRYFDAGARWKYAHKPFMLELLRVWMADENAIVRQKMFAANAKRVTPMLAQIIHQGIQEGVFATAYPDHVCHALLYIFQGLSDTFIDLFLTSETDRDPELIRNEVSAYVGALTESLERVLGAPPGSFHLVDIDTLMAWFVTPEEVISDR
jgi:AcrR family transcriptional regulator